MLQNPFTDIKIGDYLVKNVPVHIHLPFENIMVYMNNRSLKEVEYSEWRKTELLFRDYKECVEKIEWSTKKLSNMGFNKESLVKLMEMYYDNHEKQEALYKELNGLK